MKRKIILYTAVSLDGYIAGADYDLCWLFSNEDYGYDSFIESVDTLLIGKRTYQDLLTFGEFPYKNKKNYVFTSDGGFRGNGFVEIINTDPARLAGKLKDGEGKDIWLVGGSVLNTSLLNANLIDEMFLFYHPVILGGGIPLFAPPVNLSWYKTTDTKTYADGLIRVRLRRE